MVMRWLEKHFGGHINIGKLTIYGWNATHVACSYWSSYWGYICFHPPGWLVGYGKHSGWYFYVSPNATPWAAWIAFGPGVEREEKVNANIRRKAYIDTKKLHYIEDMGWRIPEK